MINYDTLLQCNISKFLFGQAVVYWHNRYKIIFVKPSSASLWCEHAIFCIQTNFLIFINVAYLRAYQHFSLCFSQIIVKSGTPPLLLQHRCRPSSDDRRACTIRYHCFTCFAAYDKERRAKVPPLPRTYMYIYSCTM